jgi:NAD+ kinase
MPDFLPVPKKIAVAVNTSVPGGLENAETIASYLRVQGIETVAWGTFQDSALNERILDQEFDLLIALGGDGTMLKAGHLGAPLKLPILGINIGHVGFLAEIQRGQWNEMLQLLLEGKYRLEERMMLSASHVRDGKVLDIWLVLNEVVVCRGHFVRPIQVMAEVNGYLLHTFVADGLIASTPTGSTAYALAAGGPILPPDLRNILIIPVAPHLSMDRAIVLSEGDEVKMTVHTVHEAVMSIDGHPPVPMLDGDSVWVTASDLTVKFVRFKDPGYFYRNITAYMEQNPTTGNRQ